METWPLRLCLGCVSTRGCSFVFPFSLLFIPLKRAQLIKHFLLDRFGRDVAFGLRSLCCFL